MGIQIGLVGRRQALASIGLGAVFVLCWSSGFIGAKLGAAEAPVATVLMWRFVPLAILLAPFLIPRHGARPPMKEWGRQIVVGALSQSGYLLTVYWAIGLGVSTGTTALIDGLQPMVVAALVGPLLGVAVSGRQWIGLSLGMLGVLLVTLADATSPATAAPWWAYPVPFAGMASLVAATFLERRGTVPTTPMRALSIHCTASAVIFSTIAALTGTATLPTSGRFWVAMAWLIAFSTFGGYGLYWYLLRRIGVTSVNTLMFLVPPVTTLWGAFAFDEPLTALTGLGLGLALSATWLVTRSPRRGDAPPTSSENSQVQAKRRRDAVRTQRAPSASRRSSSIVQGKTMPCTMC